MASNPPTVTVLGGFLGAGKTTLLNAILRSNPGRVAVIVNDFGEIDVDGRLIEGRDDLTAEVSLSAGCICCNIREDLIAALHGLASVEVPPEHILLETSGISDPRSVLETLESARNAGMVEVNALVVAVDALHFDGLEGRERRMAERQLAAADLVVLTKADLVDDAALGLLEHGLGERIRGVRLLRSRPGHVPVDVMLGSGVPVRGSSPAHGRGDGAVHDGNHAHAHGPDHAGDHDHDHDHDDDHDHSHGFVSWSWRSSAPLSLWALRRLITDLPGPVYRAKGFVHTTHDRSRPVVVQVAGRRADLSLGDPWGDEPPRTELVFIGRGSSCCASEGAPMETDDLRGRLEACDASNPEAGPMGAALGWLRRNVWPGSRTQPDGSNPSSAS